MVFKPLCSRGLDETSIPTNNGRLIFEPCEDLEQTVLADKGLKIKTGIWEEKLGKSAVVCSVNYTARLISV